MIKAFQLLLAPARTWDGISRGDPTVAGVLLRHFLPLLLAVSLVEGWCLIRLGSQVNHLGLSHNEIAAVTPAEAIRFEASQAVLSCLSVLFLALCLQVFLRSFHCRAPFRLALAAMAYSYSQLLLTQALDGVPEVPTWLCRAVGAILAAKVFYVGLVRVCRPEPSTALGLYFLGALLIFFVAGISHFVALQMFEGNLFPDWLGPAVSG
jgi:hypothetical protein